ncbi:MAG: hypothetical protein ACO3EE_04975 [Flavobacteriales bacterium]
MIIKSNSILLAADTGPAFQSGLRTELFPIALVNNLSFDVQHARTRAKQIGSADYSFDALQFSPIIQLSFNYIPSSVFVNENYLGLNFQTGTSLTSCLSGANGRDFNLYFLLSDLFGEDLIYRIKQNETLNGLSYIGFGNCALTSYSLSLAAGQLPATSLSVESVNMIMNTVTGDYINCPAVNLAVGNQDNLSGISIDNSYFLSGLSGLNTDGTGIPVLKTYSSAFEISGQNLECPSIKLSPQENSALQTLQFSLNLERENSFGFGSDFVYDRKIKYPILGDLSISAVSLDLNTGNGNLTGVMSNESGYALNLTFDQHQLNFANTKLENHSYNIDYNSFLTAEFNFSFLCNESGGFSCKKS